MLSTPENLWGKDWMIPEHGGHGGGGNGDDQPNWNANKHT